MRAAILTAVGALIVRIPVNTPIRSASRYTLTRTPRRNAVTRQPGVHSPRRPLAIGGTPPTAGPIVLGENHAACAQFLANGLRSAHVRHAGLLRCSEFACAWKLRESRVESTERQVTHLRRVGQHQTIGGTPSPDGDAARPPAHRRHATRGPIQD